MEKLESMLLMGGKRLRQTLSVRLWVYSEIFGDRKGKHALSLRKIENSNEDRTDILVGIRKIYYHGKIQPNPCLRK